MKEGKMPAGVAVRKTATDIESYIRINIDGELYQGVTGVEGYTLRCIDRLGVPLTSGKLLKVIQVSKGTLSKTLASLSRKGFIVYSELKDDRRKKWIDITPKGREVLNHFRVVFDDMEKKMLSGFKEEEVKALFDYLNRISTNLSKEVKK